MTRPLATRRTLGIVAGVVICVVGLIGLRPALAHRHAARERRALLAAVGRYTPPSPVPLFAEGDGLKARDRERACDGLRLLLRDGAVREGLLVERLAPSAGDPGLASIDLAVSGPSGAVLRYAGAIESGSPLVRLVRWRALHTGAGGSVRLEAIAAAPWLLK